MRTKNTPLFFCWFPASGRRLLFLTALAGALLNVAHAEKPEGIATDRTRVVFDGAQPRADISLMNHSGRRYLVQTRVRRLDGRTGDILPGATPFFVEPPLMVAEPQGRYHFRIIRTRPVAEQQAESLYLVSFKLIPRQTRGGAVPDAQVVLTYNVKLFYRPAGLALPEREAAVSRLRVRRQGHTLQMENPSPYWVTLASLEAAGQRVAEDELKKMLPPFGRQTYTFPRPLTDGPVRWKSIDDNGEARPGACDTRPQNPGSTALCQS